MRCGRVRGRNTEAQVSETAEEREHREAWWKRMSRHMDKASERFSQDVRDVVLLKRDLDDDFYDDLLEVLLGADVGMATAEPLVTTLRRRVKGARLPAAPAAPGALQQEEPAPRPRRARARHLL